MKLFISWSGETSQQIAQQLWNWFPLILPAVKPFITTTDIDKGARWQGEISRELEASDFGIVCLTAENLKSQWLAFEAGALSKHLGGKAATILFGVAHAQVQAPLNMFQGTLFTETDFRQLISSINNAVSGEDKRPEAQLDHLFPRLWPDLNKEIDLILQTANSGPAQERAPQVDMESLVLEMAALVRQQNAVLSAPEKFLAPVIAAIDERLARIGQLQAERNRIVWNPQTSPKAADGLKTNYLGQLLEELIGREAGRSNATAQDGDATEGKPGNVSEGT